VIKSTNCAHTDSPPLFGVGKIVDNLQRYVYYPKMQEDVAWYIRGCIICCTMKPSNRKQGLYHPLPVPTQS
jgi:hypothetical protein